MQSVTHEFCTWRRESAGSFVSHVSASPARPCAAFLIRGAGVLFAAGYCNSSQSKQGLHRGSLPPSFVASAAAAQSCGSGTPCGDVSANSVWSPPTTFPAVVLLRGCAGEYGGLCFRSRVTLASRVQGDVLDRSALGFLKSLLCHRCRCSGGQLGDFGGPRSWRGHSRIGLIG